MSGSNIYMQLITGTGPVMGEGLLEGWVGSIELKEFSWGMHALRDTQANGPGLSGMSVSAARSMSGIGDPVTIKMEPLQFKKRFDVASSQIHFCVDNHLPVVSASISVLNIKQGQRAVHQAGFVLLATKGYFSDVTEELMSDGNSVELVETVNLNFQNIKLTYLQRMGKDNLPTAPFFHPASLT